MPTLSFQIPKSDWAIMQEEADREGIKSVRELVKWRIRTAFQLPPRSPTASTSRGSGELEPVA